MGCHRNVYEIKMKFLYVTVVVMLRLSLCYIYSDVIFMITFPMVVGIAEGDSLQCYIIWVWHNWKTHNSMLIPMPSCSVHTGDPFFGVHSHNVQLYKLNMHTSCFYVMFH